MADEPPPAPPAPPAAPTPVSPDPTSEVTSSLQQTTLNSVPPTPPTPTDLAAMSEAMQGEEMPPQMIRRILYLQALHDNEKNAAITEYKKERAVLEKKYAEIFSGVYDKRLSVLTGKLDKQIDNEYVAQGGKLEEDEDKHELVGCPQFWVTALSQNGTVSETLTESDIDCLEYLSDIRSADLPDGVGFTLTFTFAENPYFNNTTLDKRYDIPNLYLDDEPMLEKISGTDIDWKEGQCLTHKVTIKKQRSKSGKSKGQIRSVEKKIKVDSFFNFFNSVEVPSEDASMDEEEMDLLEAVIDQDYDVACAFRSQLIPDAIEWFTGEANGDEEDDSDYEHEEEDVEELSEDSTDDDDDDGAAPKASKKRKDKNAAQQQMPNFNFGAAAPPQGGGASPFPPPAEGEGGENPECKQN
ncbi:hypothetical protein TrLO_g9073 [Triparma laevis f. longispina]|uniref:Nucleosome assembly protein n=1 Tax=Triparma laevis f. longispina TaxID=1714387 RepID=A0A9W7AB82_9STRA|nr:hypothetical protein TrLO_g9073 [Triparma laevis f. longispina]